MKQEMQEFERRFSEMMSGTVLPMDDIMRYMAGAGGKRLRPKLVFLFAELFGAVNETTWRTALFVEMVHTATLIHDDVVDHSDTRRGRPSVNGKWDNVSAVLAGDYLLAKAITLLSNPEEHRILKEMLDTTMAMSEGELLQLKVEREATEATQAYLDIITRKTARLIRACCVGGALSTLEEETEDGRRKTALAGDFGLHLGLVFQLRDDILDNDHPEMTAMAKQLLPEYQKKALKALDALTPFVTESPTLASLKELTVFCAERLI